MLLEEIDNPILYSTMSLAAYNINRRYYSGLHYMWCTPYFSSDFDSPHYMVPPTSSPIEIYRQLKNEIASGDQDGYKIKLLRIGIARGAQAMADRGKINKTQLNEIALIATKLPYAQFRPLLCVISTREAVPHCRPVAIDERANPLSHEYILADLPQSAFDIISLG